LVHCTNLLKRKPRDVYQAKPGQYNVTKEPLDWGKLLPDGNKEMAKLSHLCVGYDKEKILSVSKNLPKNIIPSADIIRNQHHEIPEYNIIYLSNEIPARSHQI